MGVQNMTAIWSLIVVIYGIAVLMLLGRCSYYLKQLLKTHKDRKAP